MNTLDVRSIPLFADADARLIGGRLHEDPALIRIRPGVYAPAVQVLPLAPWDRYLLRVRAFALRQPDLVFSHESAAALLGLPVFGEPADIHAYDPGRTRSKRFGDVCLHTTADERPVVRRDGILVTSAMATAVDLARSLPPALGVAVADAALRRTGASADELAQLAWSQRSQFGLRRLETVLGLADSRSESPGESVSRAVAHWLGFEPAELQVEFPHEQGTDRVDFFWPSVRVIGESDGDLKYAAADAARVVLAEKRREDRLRAVTRGFERWTWADAVQVAPLERRLVRAGIPRIRAARPALLSTLRSVSAR